MACTTTSQRINNAGAAIGRAAAHVELPPFPEKCRLDIQHAVGMVGEELISLLKRERDKLDLKNAISRDCAAFYDGLAQRLATDQQGKVGR